MPINGQVNVVTNSTEFFEPIVLGLGEPTAGYASAYNNQGLVVNFYGTSPLFEIFSFFPFFFVAPVSLSNGTFSIPIEMFEAFGVNQAYVTLTMGGCQYFRSGIFSVADVLRGGLNMFVYQPVLPPSAGVTAGTISGVLQGEGLPGDTQLSSTPWGISVQGSESQASIQFGVQIIPDKSPYLGLYLDLALNGWNISVGWPESWCESADDILNSIKSGLQSADSNVNKVVQENILGMLQGPPLSLPTEWAQTLFSNTSIQFVALSFVNNYTWPLSNASDSTVVLTPNVAIGYPRGW
jgi:hypothetical protein